MQEPFLWDRDALDAQSLPIQIHSSLLERASGFAARLEQRVAIARYRVDQLLCVERLLVAQPESGDFSLEELQRFGRQRSRIAFAEEQLRHLLRGLERIVAMDAACHVTRQHPLRFPGLGLLLDRALESLDLVTTKKCEKSEHLPHIGIGGIDPELIEPVG